MTMRLFRRGRLPFILGLWMAGGIGLASDAAAGSVSKPVTVARATKLPGCTLHVDGAAGLGGTGTASDPVRTIGGAVARARSGAVICVAEGVYPESIAPGAKAFVLAGGFQSGSSFKVRDSARFVSTAQGSGGGTFLRIVDPGPRGVQRTVVDGFEITG